MQVHTLQNLELVERQILCNNILYFNICILNCKISDYDIYHSETRYMLQMSVYVDSLMMAEIVNQNLTYI
jgi:hypothetical protein